MAFSTITFHLIFLVLLNSFLFLAHARCSHYSAHQPHYHDNNLNHWTSKQNAAIRKNKCPKFRTLDGSCTNNGKSTCGNRSWGSANTAQFSYLIGLSSKHPVRTHLPSPRLISNVMSSQTDPIPNRLGLREFFVFFGEFVDHNLVLSELSKKKKDRFDIPIPKNDALRNNFSTGFLTFMRLERTKVIGERNNPERAMNTISSVLDLSAVYSSDNERSRSLRTFRNGKLRTSTGDFLPFNSPGLHNEPSTSNDFFLAGDIRANDHPVLTSIHTIFLREHNYWCDRIVKEFPNLNDEKIYQRARLINIAQFQKIIYEEFYPAITGRFLSRYQGHNPCVNPSVSDIFSTAAYRIGHTLVGNNVQRRGPNNSPMSPIDFTQMFFRPAQNFLNNGMETFLRGALDTLAQEVDPLVSSSLRNFLFANVDELNEMVDLIAINIQRGRDNALPGYNDVRRLFDLKPNRKFKKITKSITVQSRLSTLYRSPNEIDPWIGLMSEDHVPGASMGETVLRIWEREFTRLRDGDRHFYLKPKYFPKKMLKAFPELWEIQKSKKETMKQLILRHTEIRRKEIRGNVFRK